MNVENAKSIILVILIGISAFLTWEIWTFTPKYEQIDSSGYIKLPSDKQTVEDVVKPDRIRISRGGGIYLTYDRDRVQLFEQRLRKWSLYNLQVSHSDMTAAQMKSFMDDEDTAEINYAAEVPFQSYKNILTIEDKEVPSFSFDRIFIKEKDIRGANSKLYFVSKEDGAIMEASVATRNLEEFQHDFFDKATSYPPYFVHEANDDNLVYLPANPVKVNTYRYYVDFISINNFKSALFNPKFVRSEVVNNGQEFTDGSRLMSVNRQNFMIDFINPAQRSKLFGSNSELLEKSINFVNDHAGWKNGNYRFTNMDVNEQSVRFRLYMDGYPVFNEQGMTEIEQVWGKDDIYQYKRPYFTLDVVVPDVVEKTLPSGQDVLDQLEKARNVDFNNLKDVTIGYRLSNSSMDPKKLVILEPAWYYRTGDTWLQVPFETPGGDQDGLE
ncbi:YycH family regulatory protein [Bacillus massiliglaciei]|uniref:YycH family regulatory protein n=1 Tax=Bacillus massiliglaciei TaxID=1816693 RepID=UPI001F4058EA|nr:two-component system activity regulator YycH [Bacillus massiliglaciei]